jgi:tripartite-type tricarboxylate transporter receptor subunit TctC
VRTFKKSQSAHRFSETLKRCFHSRAVAALTLMTLGVAEAQDICALEEPVEFTMGAKAGGSLDVIVRTFAQVVN